MTKQTPENKYRWSYEIGWVVEFIRKDAEIQIHFDRYDKESSQSQQRVIGRNYDTKDQAREVAFDFCQNLDKEIREFILEKVKHLSRAQE